MTLIFYECADDSRKVSKTLENALEIEGTLKTSPNDVSALSVAIQEDIAERNYCYCERLKRYYFVTEKKRLNGNLVLANLSCDVLMTYREEILECWGNVTQGNNYNPYLSDIEKENLNRIDSFSYTSPVNEDGENVLVCAGGAEVENNG